MQDLRRGRRELRQAAEIQIPASMLDQKRTSRRCRLSSARPDLLTAMIRRIDATAPTEPKRRRTLVMALARLRRLAAQMRAMQRTAKVKSTTVLEMDQMREMFLNSLRRLQRPSSS